MKVLVPVKRVPDYQMKVKVAASGSEIDTSSTKWIVNPFDEIAVEEGIRLKEKGSIEELVVVSIGPDDVSLQLRHALAMGADRAILVEHSGTCDSDLASRVIASLFEREGFDLIIMGKQAIDSDCNQTAQLISTRLKIPQACFASKIEIKDDSIEVVREIDGGLETVEIARKSVISCDLRLNEPRYASLPNIMKAKKKPLDKQSISDLTDDLTPKVRIVSMEPPPARSAGRKVESVTELVKALKEEAKVL